MCNDTRKKNRVLRGCKNILNKGIKEAEYSAFMATIIMDDTYYIKLKKLLRTLGLWSYELQNLDDEVRKNRMQTTPDL